MIYSVSFLVAFCSLVYEFVIAQTLAAVFGGTLFQYALTIGVFTFAMGFGSLLYERLKPPSWILLFKVEFALSVVGMLAPWWIVALDPARGSGISGQVAQTLGLIPGFIVGALTGLELPLLMGLAANQKESTRVLAWDYVGMFAASLLFPVLLLPKGGVWGTSLGVAGINALVGLFILTRTQAPVIWWVSQSVVLVVLITAISRLDFLDGLASGWFIGKF